MTVSTKKLVISPRSSPGEPSRDPNSGTHPNTSSTGEPESSEYVGELKGYSLVGCKKTFLSSQ